MDKQEAMMSLLECYTHTAFTDTNEALSRAIESDPDQQTLLEIMHEKMEESETYLRFEEKYVDMLSEFSLEEVESGY